LLQHKGFSPRWVSWIHQVLSSCTSAVLLNATPGKNFHCKRGVRQGDPFRHCYLFWLRTFYRAL
jgi:hypothetical protein